MINLGRLSIENFKSFENRYEINFNNTDLFILDGPNGFGKTTVFDAVEICLTGKIGRILSTDNKQKNTHLLKNSLDKPTNLFLELIKDQETILVVHASIPKDTSVEINKSKNCKADIKILDYWPDDINECSNLNYNSNMSLEKILENENISNTFDIFNYIQQEETFHYLKQKESERHDKISYLFGTNNENYAKDHINKIKNKLNDKMRSIKDEIEKLDEEKKELEISLNANFNGGVEKVIEPSNIIKNIINNMGFGSEIKQHIENLSEIVWFFNNPNDFEKIKFNFNINYIVENRKKELENIIKIGHILDQNNFYKIEKHIVWLEQLSIMLSQHKEILKVKDNNIDLELIGEFSKVHESLALKYTSKIDYFKNINTNLGSYQEVLDKILATRINLKDHYAKHLVLKDDDILSCPFCGDLKSTTDELWELFDIQSKHFEILKDEDLKKIDIIKEDLKNTFIYECIVNSNLFVDKYEKYMDLLPVLNEQVLCKDQWNNMNKLKLWLKKYNFDFNGFLRINSFDHLGDLLHTKLIHLTSKLRALIVPFEIDKDYLNFLNIIKLYGLTEKDGILLDNSNNRVDFNNVENDISFLNYFYLKSNSSILQEKLIKIKKLTNKYDIIEAKYNSLKNIFSAYNTSIKKYELNVAKQISIPFHIYSSKLLQTRPDGNGAYLQSAVNARETGYIRFVSNLSDDHDAWNTMSSGQLSGLILSFTLAMNKVYPTKLRTLLIDDPVQTMDEINLASFVQLLRNEFSNYQLVISTHERKTSSYFSYKYQFDRSIHVLNLKNERLKR